MKLLIVEDSIEVAKNAAKIILEIIKEKPNAILGLATGSTPLETYKLLVEDFNKNKTDWTHITTFNLDEYIGLDENHNQSYRYYMRENLFKYLNIHMNNVYFPFLDHKAIKNKYDDFILEKGGIDLQILGIGTNGHIAFNEPDTSFSSITHIVNLSDQTRKDNARFFNNISEVPFQAVTMGIKTILQTKRILLLATGKNKAKSIKQLVLGNETINWPCSALKYHNNLFVIIDKEASSLLENIKINKIIDY